MKFIIERECLLKPLQQINSLLVGHPALPILSNILLQVTENRLRLIGTNLEIEIAIQIALNTAYDPGTITIPARKFFDICRGLSKGAEITVTLEDERILICSGHSRYFLSTLPASNFPNLDAEQSQIEFTLSQSILKRLIELTQFSMAYQDVRYYLNGMLFKTDGKEICTVATDGHRLAVCTMSVQKSLPSYSIIVPRKGVIELMHMLNYSDNIIKMQISRNNIRAIFGNYVFTSQLIDGSFPNYRHVLLRNPDKVLKANCNLLKKAFTRVAILSNERFSGARLYLSTNQLKITANNLQREEAEEILDVDYQGNDIEIGFNVSYILEVLNVLKCNDVRMLLTNETSGMQIEDIDNQAATYVIMPMRL